MLLTFKINLQCNYSSMRCVSSALFTVFILKMCKTYVLQDSLALKIHTKGLLEQNIKKIKEVVRNSFENLSEKHTK